MRKDDLMNEEDLPELQEAVRRLPEEEQNLRMFRLKRALDLSMKHQLLPKEDWTKPEEVSFMCTLILYVFLYLYICLFVSIILQSNVNERKNRIFPRLIFSYKCKQHALKYRK